MKGKKKVFVLAVVCIFVLLFISSCGLIRYGLEQTQPPENVNNGSNIFGDSADNSTAAERLLLGENAIIGIAAYYEFDKNAASGALASLAKTDEKNIAPIDLDANGEEGYLKVSYPYDYVKIISAYKFTVNVTEIKDEASQKIIEAECGLGEIEVVVADFETYVDMNGYKQLSVQDTLICLRGYNGYYTILVNSEESSDNGRMQVFSSHKKLGEDEVTKDFTPPILSAFLETDGDSRYVYFETSDDLLSFGSYDRSAAFGNVDKIERVSRDTLYSVLELVSLPTKTVEATVSEIDLDSGIVGVLTNSNLKYVIIDGNTEGIDIQSLSVGDNIVVEYDHLFERYDPVMVRPGSVKLASTEDEGQKT